MSDSSVLAYLLDEQLKLKHITVQSFAKALGFARNTTVQMWLDGRALPSIKTLPEIAKLLDVSVARLGLLYLTDSSEALGQALPDDLRRLSVFEEVSSARAKTIEVMGADCSLLDPLDEPEASAKPNMERKVRGAGTEVR